MVGWETVVVQVSASNRGSKIFCESLDFSVGASHAYTTTSENDGVFGTSDEVSSLREGCIASGSMGDGFRSSDGVLVFSIEEITRDVQMGRTTFLHGQVKASCSELRHSCGVVYVPLEFGDCFKNRQLVHFLESAVSLGHGTSFRHDGDDGAVSPVSSGNSGQEV